MSSKKTFFIIGIAILVLIGLCGLCISMSLIVASTIMLRVEETKTTFNATTALSETLPGSESKTPTPSFTFQISTTIELSPTRSTSATLTIPMGGVTPGTDTPRPTPTDTLTLEPEVIYAPSPTIGPVALDSWCVPWNTETTRARVQAVIDGVTIEVMIDNEIFPVRYIGIELPDYSGDLNIWNSANEKNRELVEGKTVLLVKDRSEVDSEGRLLRYVLAGSIFVNRELVESGYAIATSSPPNISCDGIFQEAEALARATGRGLWAPMSTPTRTVPTHTPTPARTGNVIVIRISPKGTIWQEPEEYVEIFNDGSLPVQLQDWTLRDLKNHVFVFPNFVLGPQQYCRIYTDQYRPDNCGFTYNSPSPIWDNDGDCAYLKDGDGILIDVYCFD